MRVINKKKGFTLVEIMLVVGIIGILAGIAIVQYKDFVRRAKEGASKANLGALRSALNIYFSDNGFFYPTVISYDPAFPNRLFFDDGFGWIPHDDFKNYMYDIPLCRVGPEPSGAFQHTRSDIWHQGLHYADTVPNPGDPDVGWWYFRSSNAVTGVYDIGRMYCNVKGYDKIGTYYTSW